MLCILKVLTGNCVGCVHCTVYPKFLQCSKVYNTILESYFMVVLGFFFLFDSNTFHINNEDWKGQKLILECQKFSFALAKRPHQYTHMPTHTPPHTSPHTSPHTPVHTHAHSPHTSPHTCTFCTLPSFGHFFTKRCMLKECFLLLNM